MLLDYTNFLSIEAYGGIKSVLLLYFIKQKDLVYSGLETAAATAYTIVFHANCHHTSIITMLPFHIISHINRAS